ncbi:YkvI family membrane protein [Caldinitratiruptor microaerophilus]|uniref:Membrane protein n=1 Tax=Caldinitratiruptor microaerophilus TaxID=671077 RepID=A0AA35CL60_9FIRM|nr:hypothetical protein [Caldinitratiruptor microaerophilus]BDG61334.1 membrane protein [Caldinitratiruptor microaerophilus]
MGRTARVLQVAATYMGTVVGAGFASGQEALRFFASFGRAGLWGIAVTTVLLCAFGALVMDLGRRLGARSHRELLHHVLGPRLGAAADTVVSAFLFAALAVMLAASGAIAAEQLRLPAWVGAGLGAALTLATIWSGLTGLLTANGVVVPLLVASVLGLTGATIYRASLGGPLAPGAGAPALAAAPDWFTSAWVYAGYNIVLALAVLAPLGAEIPDRAVLVAGGVLGGLGLGVLGVGLHLAISAHLPEAANWEVPMLYLARLYRPPVPSLYTAVLWAEVYTTAVSSAFGLARRLAPHVPVHVPAPARRGGLPGGGARSPGAAGGPEPDAPRFADPAYRTAALATVALALALSPFGFARLVATLYPLFGYASVAILLVLLLRTWS